MKKYYKVLAKCGHVGRNNYTLKEFAVIANSAKESAAFVRNAPRVKHHHKDAIRSVEEISHEEYLELRRSNSKDPFFLSHSRQEERSYSYSNSVIYREEKEEKKYDRFERRQVALYKLQKEKYRLTYE